MMMVRFVFGCAFFLALSIMAVPVYYGVAENKEMITASVDGNEINDGLTFSEIYEVAAEGQEFDAAALNAIAPAAGEQKADDFSSGFQNKADSALADTPIETLIEEENSDL